MHGCIWYESDSNEDSNPVCLRWGPSSCLSRELLDNVGAAGLWTTIWAARKCMKTLCLEYLHGADPREKKSFAQVDTETSMPLRTRWYLCPLYNSGCVRGGPKTYEH